MAKQDTKKKVVETSESSEEEEIELKVKSKAVKA